MKIISKIALSTTLSFIILGATSAYAESVKFRAFDSKGVDSKNCLTFLNNTSLRLKACDQADQKQQAFNFEQDRPYAISNGQGCVSIAPGPDTWSAGRVVSLNNCSMADLTIVIWQWNAQTKQLEVTNTEGRGKCLAAKGQLSEIRIVLGDCSQKETLPEWHVEKL